MNDIFGIVQDDGFRADPKGAFVGDQRVIQVRYYVADAPRRLHSPLRGMADVTVCETARD